MSPAVFALFEAQLRARAPRGPVLEIGAVPGADSLLQLPCLRPLTPRVGVNLEAFPDADPPILQADANDLSRFADGHFATVVCNSVLEHDARFWLTVAEIRRVTASGGLVAIGVPGYAGMGAFGQAPLHRLPLRLLRRLLPAAARTALDASALTLGEHFFPRDLYRFSRDAVENVLMEGLREVEVHQVMAPPRFVAFGVKP